MNAGERQTALEHARQGDTQALGDLLLSLRPYVRLLVRALGLRRVQARLDDSDLIQEALLEIHQSFRHFKGETASDFVAWIRPIVLRTVGHALRDQSAAKRDPSRETVAYRPDQIADGADSPSQLAQKHEQAVCLAAALARLPDDMQQVLLARHCDDLSYADLAEQLQRSAGACRVLYTRALRRLRQELRDAQ